MRRSISAIAWPSTCPWWTRSSSRSAFKGWRALKAVGTPFCDKPAYSIIANLEFDAADQFRAAVAAETGPVFGDVPNFSNKRPVVVIGDLVGAAP